MTRPISHQWRLVEQRWWCAVLAVVVLAIATAGCSGARHHAAASEAGTGSSPAQQAQPSGSQPVGAPPLPIAPGDGALVAVDARTGRQLWRTPVPMASVSAPVTGRGLVVVAGTRDCNDPHLSVVAVNAKTGQPTWQRSVAADNPCSFTPPLRLAEDVVVVGGPDPDVGGGVAKPGNACDHPVAVNSAATGLDLATGSPRWQAPAAAGRILAASAGTVIADSASPGCLVGLNPATGQIRWTVAPPVIPFDLHTGGNIAVGQGEDGPSLAAIGLDCGTGKTRWTTAVPEGDNAGPVEAGHAAAVATSEQGPNITLTALATATGRQLWHDSIQANQVWTTIGPGIVVITRFSHPVDHATIESRDPRTGVRRWQSGDIGGVGSPVTDGATIVTYSQRDARGFGTADGHQLWKVPGSYDAAAVTTDAAYLAQSKPPKNPPGGGG